MGGGIGSHQGIRVRSEDDCGVVLSFHMGFGLQSFASSPGPRPWHLSVDGCGCSELYMEVPSDAMPGTLLPFILLLQHCQPPAPHHWCYAWSSSPFHTSPTLLQLLWCLLWHCQPSVPHHFFSSSSKSLAIFAALASYPLITNANSFLKLLISRDTPPA